MWMCEFNILVCTMSLLAGYQDSIVYRTVLYIVLVIRLFAAAVYVCILYSFWLEVTYKSTRAGFHRYCQGCYLVHWDFVKSVTLYNVCLSILLHCTFCVCQNCYIVHVLCDLAYIPVLSSLIVSPQCNWVEENILFAIDYVFKFFSILSNFGQNDLVFLSAGNRLVLSL